MVNAQTVQLKRYQSINYTLLFSIVSSSDLALAKLYREPSDLYGTTKLHLKPPVSSSASLECNGKLVY